VRELPLGAGKTAWRKDARALAAASGAWRGEIPLVLPDGRRLQVEWSIGRREQGGTLEILRDVTRKRVQLEALRESALYFETMFALPSMGIAMISLDGKWLRVNRTVERFTGRTAEQLLGAPVRDVIHPDDTAQVAAFRREVLEGKSTRATAPCRIPRPGGAIAHVDTFASVVRNTAGEPVALLVFLLDVTARVEAEAAARESGDVLQMMFDESPLSIALSDFETGKFIAVNRAYCEHRGTTSERVVGKTQLELFPDGDTEGVLASIALLRERGRVDRASTKVRSPMGLRDVDYSAKVLEIQGKRYVLAVAQDVTIQRHLEAALRESNERYEQAVSSIPTIVWSTELDDALHASNTFISVVADRVLGLPEGTIGSDWARFLSYVHPEDASRLADTIGRALASPGSEQQAEYRLVRPDGAECWIRSVGRASVGLDGVKTLSGSSENVTTQKLAQRKQERLEAQLQQAQKMEAVGNLAGGVAHDFNNLLTAIMGNVSLVLMSTSNDDPRRELLLDASEAASRAAGVTRQLLAFSRRQIIEPRVVQISELVDNTKRMLARLIGEDVQLRTLLSYDIDPVKVDPGQVEQILVNLAVNSRHAMPQGGQLTIETSQVVLGDLYCQQHPETKPGEYVLLAVSDSGCGMTAEVRRRVFEPFFTTKAKGQGTGLGLSMVYGAVKQHNGSIEIYSEPGRGTVVKVYLPCVRGEPDAFRTSSSSADVPVGGAETVLLVEDDEAVRGFGCRVLTRLGYSVLAEGSATAALRAVEAHAGPIDLLLTDVVLPDMNGRVLAERLLALRPSVRVLFTSGYTENVIVHHGVLDAGIRFLGKPYTVRDLAARIRKVLDARA
ncbi:MAG TPA: PAS domain S-box protein, partial [Polyangiaceae bacterium]|nr:PAS domain S-box protein [Polyangiaceae bacterium]